MNLDNKKILITGNTGFKGAWLTLYLNKICNSKLIGFSDKFHWERGIFNDKNINKFIKQYWGDIKNFNLLNSIIDQNKPDIIFHFAAQPLVSIGYEKPSNTFNTNINGTINLLESIRRLSKPVYVVIITSDKVYKNTSRNLLNEDSKLGGACPYSSSKACVEIIAETYSNISKNKYINTVRAGNVLGGGDWSKDRIIPDILKSYIYSKPIIVRNPNATRPWSYVLDILRGYIYTAQYMIENKAKPFQSYNFSSDNENKSVNQITKNILNNINYKNKIVYDPIFVGQESKSINLSNKKAKEILKWYPLYDFEKMIKYTAEWYKKFIKNENELEISKDLLDKYLKDLNILSEKSLESKKFKRYINA